MREVLGFWIAAYVSACKSAYKSTLTNQERKFGQVRAEKGARPRMSRNVSPEGAVPDEVLLRVRSAVGMGDGSVSPTSKADRKTQLRIPHK